MAWEPSSPWLKWLGKHDTVGIDLVAMCVNDVLACGAEPLFFLDYVAIGKLRSDHISQVVGGIAEGCRQAGCALVGGEMAEHPGVMNPDDYDLSGFCVGAVDRPKMLNPENVAEGDVILALPRRASTQMAFRSCAVPSPR